MASQSEMHGIARAQGRRGLHDATCRCKSTVNGTSAGLIPQSFLKNRGKNLIAMPEARAMTMSLPKTIYGIWNRGAHMGSGTQGGDMYRIRTHRGHTIFVDRVDPLEYDEAAM